MKIEQKHIITIVVAVISASASYLLNYYLTLGPLNNYRPAGAVFAASTVGIIAALFFKNYAMTGYIASFVGMSSRNVIPSIEYTILFGFVCGFVCILFAPQFAGFGGKAGTTAFLSVSITTYFLVVASSLGFGNFSVANYFSNLTSIDPAFFIGGIVAGVFGIMATIVLREQVLQKTIKTNEVVLAPAIVGLISAIIVPWIPPTDITVKLPAIIASGTYAGMASRKILPELMHYLLVGIILGIVNVTTAIVFKGFGGGLGFRGLISIVVLRTVANLNKK